MSVGQRGGDEYDMRGIWKKSLPIGCGCEEAVLLRNTRFLFLKIAVLAFYYFCFFSLESEQLKRKN